MKRPFDRLIRAAELFGDKVAELSSSDSELLVMRGSHIHGVDYVLRTIRTPGKGAPSGDSGMEFLQSKLQFHCECLCVRRKGTPAHLQSSDASLLLAQQILLVMRGQENDAMAMQLAATRRFGQGRRDGKKMNQLRKGENAEARRPKRCYVVGRLRQYFPEGSKSPCLVLSAVWCSRTDAMNQPAFALTGEQYIGIFQAEAHPSYEMAVKAAKALYKEKYPLLHAEFQLGEGF